MIAPIFAKPCALASSHHYTAGCLASLRDQAPADRKSWTSRTADERVVMEIPDRCVASNRIIEQIIRVPTIVEVGRSHQIPVDWKGGPSSGSDARWP